MRSGGLKSLYNLSDEQVEYQVRDRVSFTRFLRLGFEDSIPDLHDAMAVL
jgi:transposase, IS5 family